MLRGNATLCGVNAASPAKPLPARLLSLSRRRKRLFDKDFSDDASSMGSLGARRGTWFAAALIVLWKDPMPDNRRQFRRVRLGLRVSHIQGVDTPGGGAGELWTTDVSAGGMFLRVPPSEEPLLGRPVSFELAVPPGEGYSSSGGSVCGTGKVVRVASAGTHGVAVEFTSPLALRF